MQQLPIELKKKPLDGFFVGLSIFLFLLGFYLVDSFFLAGRNWFLRFSVVLIFLLLSGASLWFTPYRQRIIALAKGARIELWKVHWPSKDESVKTTMVVLAIISIFALFLGTVDWILALIIHGLM